jgi:hypothetical protein
MATDIKLEEQEVIVEGSGLRVTCLDLMLDHPARRRSSTPEFRRALVHDSNDGLTLNFNNDYPGGVTIHGPVTIPGLKELIALKEELLSLKSEVTRLQNLVTNGGTR